MMAAMLKARWGVLAFAACFTVGGCGGIARQTESPPASLHAHQSVPAPDTSDNPRPTAPPSPPGPQPLTSTVLRDVVTAEAIRAHLQALQAIADAHGGNRAAGTP